MPRGRGPKYIETKRILIQRLGSAYFPPGSRFATTRSVAQTFRISQQTAQSLLSELAEEGYLERRSKSGTFLPGSTTEFRRVCLVFDPSRNSPHSFGAVFLPRLTKALSERSIPWHLVWANKWSGAPKQDYVVLWERGGDKIQRHLAVTRQRGLILDAAPGTAASLKYFDSVSIDHFASGIMAGQILQKAPGCKRVAILAGPHGRPAWGVQPVLGFRAIWPRARVIHLNDWSHNRIEPVLEKIFSHPRDAVFSCGQAPTLDLLNYCLRHSLQSPFIITADKPPRRHEFPTPLITINLDEFVEVAIRIIRNRMAGDPSIPTHQTLAPHLEPGSHPAATT